MVFKLGHSVSEEIRRKIGLANKGMKTNLGKKFSEEWKKNISLNHRNYQTEEAKIKISNALKGRKPWNKGKHPSLESIEKWKISHKSYRHSEETKQKMSFSAKGIKNHNYNRRMPEEQKQKISKALMGRPSPTKGKSFSEEHKFKLKEKRKFIVLPIKDTSIELKIQDLLKQIGYEFFTHQYMKDIEHGYQCDILIPYLDLVIECDGIYWHKYPVGRDIDRIRTSELLSKGFKVLRLWEHEIRAMSVEDLKRRIKNV